MVLLEITPLILNGSLPLTCFLPESDLQITLWMMTKLMGGLGFVQINLGLVVVSKFKIHRRETKIVVCTGSHFLPGGSSGRQSAAALVVALSLSLSDS